MLRRAQFIMLAQQRAAVRPVVQLFPSRLDSQTVPFSFAASRIHPRLLHSQQLRHQHTCPLARVTATRVFTASSPSIVTLSLRTFSSSTVSASSPSAPGFQTIGIKSPWLLKRVKKLGLQQPTEIQAKAIPAILAGSSILLGAETGSGKTLAYILPILDHLLTTTPTEESSPKPNPARRFPRVVIFQPNRELVAQLEAVLESLLGPSGSLIPVGSTGEHVRLPWGSLIGTQIFPIQGKPELDILITTPVCLSLNIPFHDLLRARAKRNKAIAAAAASASSVDGESETPIPRTHDHSRFDLVEFVNATQIVVMDEFDCLIDGSGSATSTKQWIEDIWMQQRKRPRHYREKKSQQEQDSSSDPTSPSYRVPQLPSRQFIFVGATFANISPLTSFQYLLYTFTDYEDRPQKSRKSDKPMKISLENLPASCTLVPILSTHFHHLAPQLNEAVTWTKCGPADYRNEDVIDEQRLEAFERAQKKDQDLEEEEEIVDEDEVPKLDELERRALESQGKLKFRSGSGDRYFKSKKRVKYDSDRKNRPIEGVEEVPATPRLVHALNEPADTDKLQHTIDFLNQLTPDILPLGTPSRKSLMFVGSLNRLRGVQKALESHQSWKEGDPGALSPHIQFIPYHADLKPNERKEHMDRFNSMTPAQLASPSPPPVESEPSSSTTPGTSSLRSSTPPVLVTHQVLLCTSLVARGLDFHRIAPPPAPVRVSPTTPHVIRPGFTSLIQFDLAKNVVEYIHRVGRMFRHRTNVHGQKTEPLMEANGDEDQAPVTETDGDHQQSKVLNLYTAVDELLVSHIRAGTSSSSPQQQLEFNHASTTASHLPSSSTDSTLPTSSTHAPSASTFISDAAFSRNRRLRHAEKRRIKQQQQREEPNQSRVLEDGSGN